MDMRIACRVLEGIQDFFSFSYTDRMKAFQIYVIGKERLFVEEIKWDSDTISKKCPLCGSKVPTQIH